MKTREQLSQLIEDNNGEWEPEKGFIFRQDKEYGTMHIDWTSRVYTFQAFLMNAKEDMGGIHLCSVGDLENINYFIKFIKKIAEYTEYELKIDEAKTVQMPVSDKAKESKLAGKVEAYENLLINREINISK